MYNKGQAFFVVTDGLIDLAYFVLKHTSPERFDLLEQNRRVQMQEPCSWRFHLKPRGNETPLPQ